ncbi:MAG: hypothetical protein ABJG78_21385 [Cyclobacteriaceae bacterium]
MISKNISDYKISNLKGKLKNRQLFIPANTNKIIYASYSLRGKKNKLEDSLDSSQKNDFVVVEETPIEPVHITDINQRAKKEINQFYLTTDDKLKTFVELEIGKKLNRVSIIKGTTPIIDRIVSGAVIEVLNDQEFHSYRGRGKLNQKVHRVAFPVITSAILKDTLNLPFKLIHNPNFRLKRKIFYNGINLRGNDTRQFINDSSLIKEIETKYYYGDNNQVQIIEEAIFREDTTFTNSDSIVYITADSIAKFNHQTGIQLNKRTFDYTYHLQELMWRKNMILGEGTSEVLTIVKDKKHMVKSESIGVTMHDFEKKLEKVTYKYKYDSIGKISSITINRKSHNQKQSKSSYNYEHLPNGYKRSWHEGGWYDSDTYYFNEKGYLIARVDQSDTQPYVTRYEYESGSGNACSFENSYFDLIVMNPPIY